MEMLLSTRDKVHPTLVQMPWPHIMFFAGKSSKSGFEDSLQAFCSRDWSDLSTVNR